MGVKSAVAAASPEQVGLLDKGEQVTRPKRKSVEVARKWSSVDVTSSGIPLLERGGHATRKQGVGDSYREDELGSDHYLDITQDTMLPEDDDQDGKEEDDSFQTPKKISLSDRALRRLSPRSSIRRVNEVRSSAGNSPVLENRLSLANSSLSKAKTFLGRPKPSLRQLKCPSNPCLLGRKSPSRLGTPTLSGNASLPRYISPKHSSPARLNTSTCASKQNLAFRSKMTVFRSNSDSKKLRGGERSNKFRNFSLRNRRLACDEVRNFSSSTMYDFVVHNFLFFETCVCCESSQILVHRQSNTHKAQSVFFAHFICIGLFLKN